MEEACYRRNVDKEGLAQKVIDKRTVKGVHDRLPPHCIAKELLIVLHALLSGRGVAM